MARNALWLEFGSVARLPKRPRIVWNCLWGNALIRSPGINRKSRVLFPGPGFLSSAAWSSLPKKHYNGLIIIITYQMSNLTLISFWECMLWRGYPQAKQPDLLNFLWTHAAMLPMRTWLYISCVVSKTFSTKQNISNTFAKYYNCHVFVSDTGKCDL